MNGKTRILAIAFVAAIAAPVALISRSSASDHADTPDIAQNPGTDIADVYVFPSSSDPNKVVLAMNVQPLIQPGTSARFDPNVLYQFKIDNDGDYVEDLGLQFKFNDTGNAQHMMISGPIKPTLTGTASMQETMRESRPRSNFVYTYGTLTGFAGPREDPFFFDLEQFFTIFPDRATPITGVTISDPNNPQATTWRPAGQAVDFLSNGGFNVLSIVAELPRNYLRKRMPDGTMDPKSSVISVWCTTSVPEGDHYVQMDRLARPVVNEVFATVANDRHKVNDETAPTGDAQELANDIESFMTFPAGRSQAIRDVVRAVLVPDVMKVDLKSPDQASYLGVETGGATGGKFGGRKLSDDVIDISLGVVFGNTISNLGLAEDDGAAIDSLTSDNVGPEGKHFLAAFPYLGEPR
jgi:hypothetical protein